MNKKLAAGVTLLELLIAVSLLSLLSVGVLMALRVGINGLGKANAKLMDNRRMAGVQRILTDQLAGFMPVVAECVGDPERPPARMPFFQGEPQSMRFVSSYSLGEAWRGYPQVLEFQVIPGADNTGVRLVVNEHLYTGARGAGIFCLGMGYDQALGLQTPQFRPIEVGPRSFVLADRLASCRFAYREVLPPPARERWVQRWIKPGWPTGVRVEMAPLQPDASRIQPATITAPIRVNKMPGMQYGD